MKGVTIRLMEGTLSACINNCKKRHNYALYAINYAKQLSVYLHEKKGTTTLF